jgi:hypothetical protein
MKESGQVDENGKFGADEYEAVMWQLLLIAR